MKGAYTKDEIVARMDEFGYVCYDRELTDAELKGLKANKIKFAVFGCDHKQRLIVSLPGQMQPEVVIVGSYRFDKAVIRHGIRVMYDVRELRSLRPGAKEPPLGAARVQFEVRPGSEALDRCESLEAADKYAPGGIMVQLTVLSGAPETPMYQTTEYGPAWVDSIKPSDARPHMISVTFHAGILRHPPPKVVH